MGRNRSMMNEKTEFVAFERCNALGNLVAGSISAWDGPVEVFQL